MAYLLAASLAIVYFFAYRPYIADLATRGGRGLDFDAQPHVSAQTMRQLGRLSSQSSVRFTTRHPVKRDGVLRLCALGDSNTAGAEASPDNDYPSYLQREFDALGVNNVEVINFGNNWHGFAQVAVMWEDVASRYRCDVVVLLPYDFWWSRDTTFNHAGTVDPYYLHARYVISGDGVARVEASGATAETRFDRYHALLPRWRYIRHDYQAPALIRAMLPEGKALANPFYYADDPRDEAWEIHRRLLARIAADGVPVLVFFEYGANYRQTLMAGATDGVGYARRLDRGSRFPYKAPIWHRSSWGNELTARAVLRLLLDSPPPPGRRFRYDAAYALDDWDPPPPLNAAQRVSVGLGREAVGVFVSVHDRQQGDEERHHAVFEGTRVEGLLALYSPDQSFLDACLLPLEHRLAPGDEVHVEDGRGVRVSLGRPRLAGSGAALWLLEVPGARCARNGPLQVPTGGTSSARTATLSAGGNAFAAHWRDGALRLGRTGEPMFRFSALGYYPADSGAVDETGEVTLLLDNARDRRAVPIARWSLELPTTDVEVDVPLPVAIGVDADRAALVTRRRDGGLP